MIRVSGMQTPGLSGMPEQGLVEQETTKERGKRWVRQYLASAISAIRDWSVTAKDGKSHTHARAADTFGSLVFNDEVQQTRLPKAGVSGAARTITHGEPLDASVADAVASAMKDWAVEHGATHYTHWFQPLTGITAEKHDSFLSPDGDGKAVAEFSGKELIQGEPDASSFPSGGMRSTFEARGYTAWDPTSPPWLLYSGGAVDARDSDGVRELDRRDARQEDAAAALDGGAVEAGGARAEAVRLDRRARRHDLRPRAGILPDRSVLLPVASRPHQRRPHAVRRQAAEGPGARGSVLRRDSRSRDGVHERTSETELYKVGVPVKTRHNEVAPSQYEIAPVFENANVATDHQMMTMETMRRMAPKYGLACLLHEKPFAGVNGSGKHLNWSMSDDEGHNLLSPGANTHENLQFLVFCTAVLRAVNKWQGLLRASIASAGNDHRLGANEAPPAILSVFLGDMLTDIFEQIEKGGAKSTKHGGTLDTGVIVLPKLPRDAGDRNRTSPFAFTGNKFEFRAVSSGQSIALPEHRAERGRHRVARLHGDRAREGDEGRQDARAGGRRAAAEGDQGEQADHLQRQRLLEGVGEGSRQARSAEPEEHGRRAAAARRARRSSAIFEKYKVLNERELHARYEIMVEQYNKTVNVEGQLMVLMANRYILPAAIEYQKQVAAERRGGEGGGRQVGRGQEAARLASRSSIDEFKTRADKLAEGARARGRGRPKSTRSISATSSSRRWTRCATSATRSKQVMPHELWPLATYREMLFIK